MAAVVIAYPPMAGGNHLKNLLCLDSSFANSSDLNTGVYTDPSVQPVGTVHSVGGRNVHKYLIDAVTADQEKTWLIHGHFGELAPFRTQLNSLNFKKYIIITIDTATDKQLLFERQQRLGGTSGHPYYLDEEQQYLYQPSLYETYFESDEILTCSISQVLDPDLNRSKIINQFNNYLNTNINVSQAQELHTLWWNNNFLTNSDYVRNFYHGKKESN